MRKASFIIAAVIAITMLAFAQSTPTPPAPPAPPVAATPATPATPPKAPRAPRAPRVRNVRGSYLGVDTRDVTPERVPALKLKSAKGVEVVMVDQDAPAGKAGLKEHDVITTFNGKPVEDMDDLRDKIRSTSPGTKVSLGIVRDGQPISVTVELGSRNTWNGEVIRVPKIEIPPMPEIDVPSFAMLQYSRRNGLMVENVTRQLGEFFGAKDGKGVLVRSVEKNSPAEAAGFRAGDLIIRVGNEPVENMADWNQIMRQQQAGKVPVTVIREKREATFSLSMPERGGDRSRKSAAEDCDGNTIELADLGPEIQAQMEAARAHIAKEFNSEHFQKDMQNMQKELNENFRANSKEWRKEMEKARQEMQKAMKDVEKQHLVIENDDSE